ncbi:uncharacterized protein EV420DRAFT_1147550 [Desarmillaria tabescens]|uniref:Uncharacterized protein n=1 Tax=Armillaria tabescens TaxID=1929756 RepID=A0AA39NC79_ARMTA|nr:uncharacterized protein EV420DRAFT_1147550 [Desarmillaria tabescens]KAK0462978.1 hypothetical protein EV420DRAFT_1147550 [Desarmillaria tabescens]
MNPMLLTVHPRTLILGSMNESHLLDTPFLGALIARMKNLRTVSITYCDVEGWPYVNVFATPSKLQITSLEIRRVQMTFREFMTLLSSPCLTHLRLSALTIGDYPSSEGELGIDFTSPDCRFPQPQSALQRPIQDFRLDVITTSDIVIMDLIATSRHPIIAEGSMINVSFSSEWSLDEHVSRFQRFLDCKAVKSAQKLHLGSPDEYFFTEEDSSEYDPLIFDRFKTVELRSVIPRHWDEYETEFQWWANSLSAVRVGSALKKLRLIVTFISSEMSDLPDVALPVWPNLDAALCGRNLALDRLVIDVFSMGRLTEWKKPIIKNWFFTCLPKTYKKYFTKETKNASLRVHDSLEDDDDDD